MVAEKNRARPDSLLLCQLDNVGVLEQWTSSAAQGAVCGDENALLFAEVDDVLLRQQRMVFDLVDGRDDADLREELFEISLGVVGHADGLDFATLQQLFEILVRVHMRSFSDQVSAAIGQFGELFMIAFGVHLQRTESQHRGMKSSEDMNPFARPPQRECK